MAEPVGERVDEGRLLSQLLMLTILLTNKRSAHLVRVLDGLREMRVGALGVDRIASICGSFVMWSLDKLCGPGGSRLLVEMGIQLDEDALCV